MGQYQCTPTQCNEDLCNPSVENGGGDVISDVKGDAISDMASYLKGQTCQFPGYSKASVCLDLGACTIGGVKTGMPDWQNQDSFLVEWISGSRLLVAVFDGHGPTGKIASQAAAAFFRAEAQALASASPQQFEPLFNNLFARCHAKLEADGISKCGGTTAVVAVVDIPTGTVSVGHVGDSRMVGMLGQCVLFETSDHLFDAAAMERIKKAGGEVREDTYMSVTCKRVFRAGCLPNESPALAMSRSLGDGLCHAFGVTHEPSVQCQLPCWPGCCLLLASDGVWDKFSTEEAAREIAPLAMDPRAAAKSLVERARHRWMTCPGGARDIDDITAVVVSVAMPTQRGHQSSSCADQPLTLSPRIPASPLALRPLVSASPGSTVKAQSNILGCSRGQSLTRPQVPSPLPQRQF